MKSYGNEENKRKQKSDNYISKRCWLSSYWPTVESSQNFTFSEDVNMDDASARC